MHANQSINRTRRLERWTADLRSFAGRLDDASGRVFRRVSVGIRKRQARIKQSRSPQKPTWNADRLHSDPIVGRVLSFSGTNLSEVSKSSHSISALGAG